ncbi:hypothetical protein AO501_07715 [Mycobacterium gordonae]|uniref:HNH endonuclease n=1 Tax=Mycobacterium gordonae TaxID=1778 RepID=A0A0Q2MG70_MYCGO|nr:MULTISPECIES: hypothetical protein [Mycobacterium]KQH78855.1 hypothetical protein AO501_07715 [Mycobacterium gordonae]MDP7728474.1 hypothetical protein [Mycobacterium sp. TY813]
MKLCTVCQAPCGEGSRCDQHKRKHAPTPSATARGYGYSYQKLRAQAIALQPFCTDCQATDNLTLDHTPESWRKVERGRTLTLRDVRNGLLFVRCQRCNQKAGNARGSSITHEPRLQHSDLR